VTATLTLEQRVAASRVLWTHRLARAEQLPPDGDWMVWLLMAGRGAGKTRTAAEELAWQAIRQPNTRWAILSATFADGRDTCVEGVSGILSVLRRYGMLRERNPWNRSIGELALRNGSRIKVFSADEPERLRGPQHHGAWVDELGSFRYDDAWDQLQFGLRLGLHPRTIVTTTPRPKPIMRRLVNRKDGSVVITNGRTLDNKDNLAPAALAELLARYDGTRIGRAELEGELLEDVEGALWTQALIDLHRLNEAPPTVRTVVAVDPAATDTGDETGIVVCSRDNRQHGYVLADYSLRGTPDAWARRVVEAYDEHEADTVVVEVNQGGQMIASVLRTVRPNLPIREVRASKGKQTRAEPVSALYEQGRVHHVGTFAALEDQLTTWTADDNKSPDRLDALVWGMTELIQHSDTTAFLSALAKLCDACGFPNRQAETVCQQCHLPLNGC
jgi:phage terminase large subunit-like protein